MVDATVIPTMEQRIASLTAPSARSNVPPFMVMDVMAAAERIEAS
ncbi:MAG: pyridoxal phosphate-dependent aminotransferase, partial [Bradyrhizobium sp.]|nr:pyridoxal phosphate-dependent aminotransferase [Bradyrhizobium sp.]